MIKNIKPVFYGEIMDGKLKLDNKVALENYVRSLTGKVQLTIGKRKNPRSTEENNYYWGVIVTILADYMGDSNEVMHELLKSLFLKEIKYKTIDEKQIRFERVKSTAELSTVEAEEYYEQIRIWAATTLGVSIPLPNEVVSEDPNQTQI